MSFINLNKYRMVQTDTEKLFDIFKNKLYKIESKEKSRHRAGQAWKDYLGTIPEIKYILNFSEKDTPVGYLIEEINSCEDGFNKFIIRDPFSFGKDYFIILEKEFAMKVLVLGSLP
jgi:hypothetical protein